MYFWLKAVLDTLHNEAGCLTSGANTPAPSDWPGAQGRRHSASPGRGWLPNNPRPKPASCAGGSYLKLKADNCLLGFCYCPCSVLFFPPATSLIKINKHAGSKVLHPIQWHGTPGLHFMFLGCFLRKPSRCRSMGVKGMHMFKVLETGCQIALQESRIISSFPKPGVRS